MNAAKMVVILVLVLVVGIFAGSLGTRIYLRHELQRAEQSRQTSEEKVNRIVGRLTDDLKLDAGQQAEVRKIITATEARATGLKALYAPELKKIYDRSFEQIGAKLNAEQKIKLQKRQDKLSSRYNAIYFKSLQTARAGIPDMDTISLLLNLNASQRDRVQAIMKDRSEREDLVIGKYQKTERPDIMALERELQRVRAAETKDLSHVLSRDQLDHFKTDVEAY
jgi:Zn-dependent oligopeptidase